MENKVPRPTISIKKVNVVTGKEPATAAIMFVTAAFINITKLWISPDYVVSGILCTSILEWDADLMNDAAIFPIVIVAGEAFDFPFMSKHWLLPFQSSPTPECAG